MRANTQNTGRLSWADRVQLKLMAGVAALFMVALMPLDASAENEKVAAFSEAPHAEKINANLLDLEDQVRRGLISLSRAASGMAMNTAGEGIQIDIVMNRVDDRV